MNRIVNRSNAQQETCICSNQKNNVAATFTGIGSAVSRAGEFNPIELKFNLVNLLFSLMLVLGGSASAQSIFTNPITGTNPTASNPYTSGQTVNSNITVSGIGYGSGMTAITGNDRYIVRNVNSSSLNSNDYFQFTLTPKSCFEIDFVSLVYSSQISSGSISLALRSSLDNYASNIATSSSASGATMSLSGAGFQNRITATTFRLYVWGASGSSTTFSINSFTFNGTINSLANTIALSSAAGSNNQSVYTGLSVAGISYSTTGATGATFSGLPAGVNGSFASNVATISGTPSASGTFNYSVSLTGGCGSVQASGSITVLPIPTINNVDVVSPIVAGQPAASGYNGQTINISGTGFTANASVSINGIAATSVIVNNSTSITAVVNNTGANSTGNLSVSIPSAGVSASSPFNFIGYISKNNEFNWSGPSSWLGNTAPVNGSDVTILHNGTIGSGVSASLNRIEIKSGTTLNMATEGSILVNDILNAGLLNWTASGTLNIAGQLTMSASGAIQPGNGTIVYSKAGNQSLLTGAATELNFNNLVLQGSGVKSVPAGTNLQVKNISIGSGTSFTPPATSNGISINGDLTVDGTLTGSSCKFLFNSSSDQTISVAGTGTAVFSSLWVNKNSGTLLLNDNVRVLDTLNMISGNINTQGNMLEIGSSIANKGILAHTSGYIHGKVRRWYSGTNSGNATGLFPIGELKAGSWENRHALLEYTTAATAGGHLTIEFIPVSMTANGAQASIDESAAGGTGFNISTFAEEGYWKIDNQAGALTDGAYNIALSAENFTSIGADISMLSMVKRVSMGSWFAPGQHIPATGDLMTVVTLRRSGVSGFSNFGFGAGNQDVPLPVTISSINIQCDGFNPALTWTTVSEQDASHFVIQQSSDGRSWKNLGSVSAAGNSDKMLRYRYSLANMDMAAAYVRLVLQNKFTGDQTFAPLAVSCRQSLEKVKFTLYPNPTEGAFFIDLQQHPEGNLSIRVLNALGAEVAQQLHTAAHGKLVKMDLNGYAAGIYQVLVGNEGEAPAQSFKLIVK